RRMRRGVIREPPQAVSTDEELSRFSTLQENSVVKVMGSQGTVESPGVFGHLCSPYCLLLESSAPGRRSRADPLTGEIQATGVVAGTGTAGDSWLGLVRRFATCSQPSMCRWVA